ncbi:hypothetical protein [Streptomyces sp. NBC_00258]|uniref:hypothetical protein n=1 Tax=Streptomyces sp. NBC_00258 TaxID=2903642 RepID=UPI002E2DA108|nr:hypothetical protein [Streptomyces sp. NBC_00258]
MGVFARLLRKDGPKSKGSEEASPAEAEAGTVTDESGADAEDAAKGSATAEPETSSGAATESAESDESAAEGVEIPKQQSVEEAADSEAGEGARK